MLNTDIASDSGSVLPSPSEFATLDQMVDWNAVDRLRELAMRPGNSQCGQMYASARREYLIRWEPAQMEEL